MVVVDAPLGLFSRVSVFKCDMDAVSIPSPSLECAPLVLQREPESQRRQVQVQVVCYDS